MAPRYCHFVRKPDSNRLGKKAACHRQPSHDLAVRRYIAECAALRRPARLRGVVPSWRSYSSCAMRLCRVPVAACAVPRSKPERQGRRHRGADRRLLARVGRDGTAGRRLRQAAPDLGRASDQTAPATSPARCRRASRSSTAASISTIPRSTPAATPRETRRWAHERGFKSLIVVTSNYHMPRAIVELSHAMPERSRSFRSRWSATNGARSRGGRAARRCGCCCPNMSNTSPPSCGCVSKRSRHRPFAE